VKCEGKSVETSAVKNSQNPEWNESFLFYRRDPKENHMKLSLWNKNLAIDGFIGQALVKSLDPFENTIVLEMKGMAIPVVEFSREGYKIRKVFG
jgi:hypothetical protein